jgi:hypothetical protein
MQNRGWIKLHRRSLDSLVFRREKLWKVWSFCLMRASHKGGYKFFYEGRERRLKAGQFVTGRISGAQDCDMSQSTFRNQLETLKNLKCIDMESDNKMTVVTIINWGKYQKGNSKKDSKRTSDEHRRDNDGTMHGYRMNTYKNDNNATM